MEASGSRSESALDQADASLATSSRIFIVRPSVHRMQWQYPSEMCGRYVADERCSFAAHANLDRTQSSVLKVCGCKHLRALRMSKTSLSLDTDREAWVHRATHA